MATPDLVNLSGLLDDAKCFAFVRQRRWPDGVRCPSCDSDGVTRDGCDDTQPCRQRHRCKACGGRFDDLTGTVLASHHQPLRVWVLCLYFMGLNLSSRQIAMELGLSASDVQAMPSSCAMAWWPGRQWRRWKARSRSTRSTWWPGTRATLRWLFHWLRQRNLEPASPAAVAKGGGAGAVAGWRARRVAARWRRTSRPSSA
jgi:transposase-like protein